MHCNSRCGSERWRLCWPGHTSILEFWHAPQFFLRQKYPKKNQKIKKSKKSIFLCLNLPSKLSILVNLEGKLRQRKINQALYCPKKSQKAAADTFVAESVAVRGRKTATLPEAPLGALGSRERAGGPPRPPSPLTGLRQQWIVLKNQTSFPPDWPESFSDN